MNLPNKLTVLRMCLIPVFLVALLTNALGDAGRYAALAIFLFASFTDFLDGYIARKHNLITNFGKFMDPLADKLLVCSALIALVELGGLNAWVVIIIISREFIITGFRLVAADKGVVIAAGFWGKVKTVTQMSMVIFLLLDVNGTMILVSNILIFAAVLFTIISGVEYIYKNIGVLKEN